MKENILKFKVELIEPHNKFDSIFLMREYKANSHYGNDTYIAISRLISNFNQTINYGVIDCRYQTNYNMEKTCKQYLKDYFGKNLKQITLC